MSTLRVALKTYPHTRALKEGRVSAPGVGFDFVDVSPIHKAFAPMVRQAAYDVSELAIVTALQAVAYDRPIVLLPAVVASRFQRGCIIGSVAHGVPSPETFAGRKVAVRAYTQTTGMWVRAHLAEDFGIDPGSVRWLTHDAAHVAEYRDPPNVEAAPAGTRLEDLLLSGDVDAAIFGNDLPDASDFAPVIPDAAERDLAWWRKHGFMPINHMVAASRDACIAQPDAIRATYRLLKESAQASAGDGSGPTPWIFGFDALRGPVQWVIDACMQQALLPRTITADDVFAPAMALLGGDGA